MDDRNHYLPTRSAAGMDLGSRTLDGTSLLLAFLSVVILLIGVANLAAREVGRAFVLVALAASLLLVTRYVE